MPAPLQLACCFDWLKNNLFSGLPRGVEVKLFIFIHPDFSTIHVEIHFGGALYIILPRSHFLSKG